MPVNVQLWGNDHLRQAMRRKCFKQLTQFQPLFQDAECVQYLPNRARLHTQGICLRVRVQVHLVAVNHGPLSY